MPIAAGEGHCALGVDGACNLETASQAVHAGGCLPGEAMQAGQWMLLGGGPGIHTFIHPTTLGATDSLCKDLQPFPVGHFGRLCHWGMGWVARRAEGQEAQPWPA